MTTRVLLAAAAVAAGSAAPAQYVPYYGYGYGTSVNPYTGALTQTAAGYNPFTGAPTVVQSGYNPFTGSVGQTVAQYNPYTGTTVRNDQAFNPYTGLGYNFTNAYNPYLAGGYGYGVNPYLGYSGLYPPRYPGVGTITAPRPVVAPRVSSWSGAAVKPGVGIWRR